MSESANGRPPREYAALYAHTGLTPIPVSAGSKEPELTGWQRVTRDDLDRLFPVGYAGNVGLLNGAPQQSPVDHRL